MTTDSLGVVDALRHVPEQLAAAHENAAEAIDGCVLPRTDEIDAIVFCGMGGSGIVGDLVAAVGTTGLPVPVVVVRQYRMPAFVGPRSLVFAVSCSGDTEETIAAARGAADAGAQLVTIASGGELADLGRERGFLHLPVPAGLPGPRFGLGAMVAPALATLFKMRLMPDAHAGLLMAQQQLAHRRDECVPEGDATRNPARELARRIGRTVPVIYGQGNLGAVAALRWKQSMNENAKAPAYWNQYPELDHNEICGWGQHGDVTRQVFTIVELEHGLEDPRLARRSQVTRELVEECVASILTVAAGGEGRLAQLLDLIYVGDWTSVYVAFDNDVDPGPIDAIVQLKAALRTGTALDG